MPLFFMNSEYIEKEKSAKKCVGETHDVHPNIKVILKQGRDVYYNKSKIADYQICHRYVFRDYSSCKVMNRRNMLLKHLSITNLKTSCCWNMLPKHCAMV